MIKTYQGARLLLILISVAFGLRWYHFGDIPHGVNRDEASIAYTAHLLAQTGKDEYGRWLPIRFQSFGDWKQPIYLYLTIPFITSVGLTPVAVRLPSLLASLLLFVPTFFLANQLTGKPKLIGAGLLAVMLLVVNPWHFHFSHLALEAMVAITFFYCGLYLLLSGHQHSDSLGILLLLGSMFTYHAALLIVPVWFMIYLCLQRRRPRHRLFRLMTVGFFIVTALVFIQAWTSPERDKISGTTIVALNNEELWDQIYRYRHGALSSLWINQYTYFAKIIASHYLQSLSPLFLWQRGGTHPHYNVPGFGNFYPLEIGLFLLGAVVLFARKNRVGNLLLWLLLLAPLPAAITRDGVHSTREIFLIPAVQIIAGYGAWVIFNRFAARPARRFLALVFAVLLLAQSQPFLTYYWTGYKAEGDRRFGGYLKELSLLLQQAEPKYPLILVTFPFESPYIFQAFYTKMPAQEFMDSIVHYPPDNWGFTHVEKLGRFEYPPSVRALGAYAPAALANSLVVARPGEIKNHQALWILKDLGGNVVMEAYETNISMARL